MTEILPVILSGGAGTRLWPASRSQYPKQLLSLGSERTLLQATALRMDGMPGGGRACTVVCNEAHRFLVAEQLREIGREATVILEPEGRNTAPAVALAALLAAETDPDQLLLVMPADHRITELSEFQAAILRGIPVAREARLVTFGIVPVRAETGFGYVRAEPSGTAPVPVIEFVEKPDRKTAQAYVSSGQYFWNSGIFLFTAQCFLDTLRAHAPDIHAACTAAIRGRHSGADFTRPDAAAFLACRSDSIDYALMENTDRATVVPMDAGWSDVGSWEALHAVSDSDNDNNFVSGDVLLEGCRDTYVSAESRLVAAVGLDDIVIVETRDSILVARKSRSQDVKAIVDRLKSLKRGESELHRKVFRPWGSYDSLECRHGFQVKRLVIRPGAVISLQRHAHRVEHWIVVKGRARITRNEEEFDIGVNESAHIGIGEVHRIANPFDEPVHIIEVQCGDYLGEDDIERLEDIYGRAGTTT
jgi:mannose-1-phosphate guanylyltransferase / mannose-6-phosphate isomerase